MGETIERIDKNPSFRVVTISKTITLEKDKVWTWTESYGLPSNYKIVGFGAEISNSGDMLASVNTDLNVCLNKHTNMLNIGFRQSVYSLPNENRDLVINVLFVSI